jgi:PAS domain S-box-containing protein
MTLDHRKYNLLIVEDNPGDLLLITDYLEDLIANPVISSCASFAEATAFLSENVQTIDVILLDLSLPDMTGEQLISGIISKAAGRPIIVLTGYADFQFGVRSLSLGVSDYLLKDEITGTILHKSIVYSIERKRIANQLRESEKRYFDLFHLSPQPMWVYDLESLRYIQVNQAAINRYGYTEFEFLQMSILDLRRPEEHQKVLEANQYIQSSPISSYTGRFKHLTKSQESLVVDVYSNIITSREKKYGLVIGVDVTENVNFDNKITKAIIQAQEQERYEIGSELHDNVCQILATSNIRMGLMNGHIEEGFVDYYNQSKDMINLALKEIRNLSHRLAPVFYDVSSIDETFEKLLNTFNVGQEFQIDCMIDHRLREIHLNNELHLNLFRILQEQLRNILKYANATSISLSLELTEEKLLNMSIKDDGIGFDLQTVKSGIGLANMRRRVEMFGGEMEINTAPGDGCEICVRIPLQLN